MVGITAYGGYVLRYRLSRMLIIQNMAWYFPVIMAVAGGEKARSTGLPTTSAGFQC